MGRVTRVFHRGETQTSLVKIETREPTNEYVPFYLRDVGVLPVTVSNHHFYLPTDGWTNNLPKPKIFPPFLSLSPSFPIRREIRFDEIDRNANPRLTILREKNSILSDRCPRGCAKQWDNVKVQLW